MVANQIIAAYGVGGICDKSELYFLNIRSVKNKSKIRFFAASLNDESYIDTFNVLTGKKSRNVELFVQATIVIVVMKHLAVSLITLKK
ncbi:MAG: hypothetical protein ACK5LT_13910 [Lachnospirales bacterium]